MSDSVSIRWALVLLGMVLVCATDSGLIAQEPLYFKNVSVFDGDTGIGVTNVLVQEGKIAAIGVDVKPGGGATVIDGTGKTLMPGMIDCHTHVWFETHLQQAADFGVTTEMDMMAVARNAAMLRRQQTEGQANNRADFFSAGPAVTVADGHGTQFGFPVPTLDDAAQTGQFVNERVREGSDYIKLIYEDGSAYGFTRPTLSPEMFAAAVVASHENDKLAVSHVSTLAGAAMAIESDIDGLVHLFADKPITPGLIELAKSKGIFVVPTATVISNASGANLTKMVIEDEHLKPFLNNETLSNLASTFPQLAGQDGDWKVLRENISKLHEAGIPILAGTDSPNPGTDHGVSMHQELRMLVEAGLSNEQALAAATSLPAKHFQLNDRGRIAAGMRADLVLVDGDPTEDVAVVAKIVGVWKGGHPIDRQSRLDAVKAEQERATEMADATEDRLISDFEDEKVTAKFGAGWNGSTDSIRGGDSTVEMKILGGGADGSQSSLEISGVTRQQQPAFAGAMFSPGTAQMQAGDISAHKSISFWAKGTGETCQVMMFFQKRGFQPSMKEFVAGSEWKQYDFKIADFDGCDGTDVLGFWFGTGTPGEFKFQIDQVQLKK